MSLESMDVRSAVTVVQLLDTGECECFPALAALRLCSIWGLAEAAAAALFVQFIQVLFTDRVSRNLRSLELIGVLLRPARSCVSLAIVFAWTLTHSTTDSPLLSLTH